MNPLFPEAPEDLASLSDDELSGLIGEFDDVKEKIRVAASKDATDEQYAFIAGRKTTEVMDEMTAGIEKLLELRAEAERRETAVGNFRDGIEELASKATTPAAEEASEEAAPESDETSVEQVAEEAAETAAEVVAEAEAVTSEVSAEAAQEADAVAASGDPEGDEKAKPVRLPAPPRATRDRASISVRERGEHALIAAGGINGIKEGDHLDRLGLAQAIIARSGQLLSLPPGFRDKSVVASAKYEFDPSRVLEPNDHEGNRRKVLAAIPDGMNADALTASGGLCAPLTPIYAIPNWAVQDRPVRDALPSFRATRGGVNVPTPSIVGDAADAITVIEEADDALGGTFATKSCLDQTCPAFTETAVTVISHCRTFGNLNSRAWPEFVAHENDITMAAHARTAETYLLDQIKAASVNVTNGAETLGAMVYLVDAVVKATFGIRGRLRMRADARFRALLPAVLPSLLALDTVQTQFDRFRTEEQLVSYLRGLGIEPVFYLDSPSSGTSQIPDASQAAAALDGLPDTIQWAIFPEGGFIHVDGGSLELGIVRDSTLNETNDYQVFGETFENVARVAPAQAALWVTSDLCASGQFPPAGTVRTCD